MNRWLCVLAGVLLPAVAVGQVMPGSGIVRHYNFEASGRDYYPAGNPPDLEIRFGQDPALATLTPDRGSFEFTRNGAFTRVDDTTYPAGPSGARGQAWSGDGSTMYLTCSEAQGCSALDTPTDMTICIDAQPGGTASVRHLIAKYNSVGVDLRSWTAYSSGSGNMVFLVSDDGTTSAGHYTVVTATGAYTNNSRAVGCFTWRYVTDGTSQMRAYFSGAAAVSTDVANGPIFDNDLAVGVFSTSLGQSIYQGQFNHLAVWASKTGDHSKVLSEAECRRWIAGRWGTYDGTSEGLTVVNASGNYERVLPQSLGESNYIQAMPPNSAAAIVPVSGLMGIQGDPQIINRAWRWGAEAWAGVGAGGCTNYPTGWVPACVAGDGTADIVPVTAAPVPEGGYAIGLVLTGTTSVAVAAQHCDTDGIGAALDVQVEHRCASGTCGSTVQIYQYSDGACAVPVGSTINAISIGAGSSTWTTYRGRVNPGDWDVAAASYRVRPTETGNGGVQSNWDALVYQNSTAGVAPSYALCGANSDADVTCNHTYVYDGNPIRGNMPFTIDWRGFSAWERTSLSAGAVYFLGAPSGADSWLWQQAFSGGGYTAFYLYDHTATVYTIYQGIAWAADTPHHLRWSRTGFGTGLGNNNGSLDGTAFAGVTGLGTAIFSGWKPNLYLVGSSSNASYVSQSVLSDLVIYNRVLP